MARSLPFRSLRSLVFCFFLTAMHTLAEAKADAKHLSPFANDHKSVALHQQDVHGKHRSGERHDHSKRCNASEHFRPSKAPGSDPSKKWGLAWPNGDASYLANFARPKVRYLYTWSPYLPASASQLGLESIPMLWGSDQVNDFQRLVSQGYATKVLGMNEPNEPSQSNMSPQDGIQLWTQYIEPLKSQGYYLISPACTNDQAGLDWMQAFAAGCTNCTIDAIAFHFYGTDPQALVKHATTLYNTYKKPIWITEFADQNFSGSGGQASMSEIYAFQSAVIHFVDETPWIEAAFPFGVMHNMQGVNEDNSLLTDDGWPTSLAYNYFG